MCNLNLIPIDQFAEISHVTVNTVKRNYRKIPGITKENGQFRILSGTRYPYPIGKCKIDSSAEKRYILLKAISEYRYVDCYALRIEQPQFINMLRDLIKAGLIEQNNLSNHYGANAYDCTELGAQIAERNKKQAIREMANLVAEVAGHFAGGVISVLV